MITITATVDAGAAVFASGVGGGDITFDHKGSSKAVYVTPANGSVVQIPCSGPCTSGTPAVLVPAGVIGSDSRGIAVDNQHNVYVAAGFGFANTIYQVPAGCAAPCTSGITVVATGFANLRSLGIAGQVLYAADFGAGEVIEIPLNNPGAISTFATIGGVFGLFAAGVGDLYVTSNAGCNGFACGVGDGTVKHVTAGGIDWSAPAGPFPEGLSGDGCHLYIATNTDIFSIPRTGGFASLFSTEPVFSHGVDVGAGRLYASETSFATPNVYRINLLACP
jgi:hypothetical protein